MTKPDGSDLYTVTRILSKAGNRMGTARRCNLARLFLTLRSHQQTLRVFAVSNPEGIQILTRVSESVIFRLLFPRPSNSPTKMPDFAPNYLLADCVDAFIRCIGVGDYSQHPNALLLPYDFTQELKHAGLLM